MTPGTIVLIIVGALMVSVGAVMIFRGRGRAWALPAVFGLLMLGAAVFNVYVTSTI